MFKKPIKIGAQNQLSGKDRKAMKSKLNTQFDEECVQKIFVKNEKIICNKITGSKMLIYICDDQPLFVDGTGKQDYFPSIYVATAYESVVKSIIINEGVEEYIFNGANLMWPGVKNITILGKFKKDQTVAIRTSKGQVIAIGAMGCSYQQLTTNKDGSGIAVYILHFRGDKLWDLGPKVYPEVIIKAKIEKIQQKIQPLIIKQQAKIQVVEKVQQPKTVQQPQVKGKNKKNKKSGKQKKQQQSQQEVKPQPKKNIKQQKKIQTKKKPQPQVQQQSDQQLDFGAFIQPKNNQVRVQPNQVKNQKKKIQFSDDQDDRKNKKKGAKKQTKKKQVQQEDEPQPPKKQQKQAKNKHKQQDSDQQQQVKKPKKGKGKKGFEQSQQQQQQNKKQNKKKQTKKDKKKVQSGSDAQQKQQNKQEGDKQQKSSMSTQLMDQHFRQAFLNVLKLSKIQGQLPIDSGRFFSDYMVLARSQGVKLQIKDTSFKKLGKFYEQMAKAKIIQFKPAKQKKGQQGSTISKIFWDNEQLKNYFPTIKKMGQKDQQQKVQQYTKQKLKLSRTVQVDYVYKLNDDLKKILLKKVVNLMPDHSSDEQKPEDLTKDFYFTQKQLKDKVQKYINQIAVKQNAKQAKEQKKQKVQKGQKGQKGQKNDKQITLNYKQNQFIYKLLQKQIEQYQQNLAKQQQMLDQGQQKQKKIKKKRNLFRMQRGYIVNKIMKQAQSYYNLIDKQNGVSKFCAGAFKGIQLIADKVVNKNVTKILGLQVFIPANVKQQEAVKQIHGFAHQLQVKFASSASVQNLPGKNAGKQIVIQGNFVDEIQNILMMEYGIRKQYISIQNKLGKKKKN